MTATHYPRSAVGAMYVGLALAVVATLVVHLDQATSDVLAGHIRAGYPSYSQAHIDTAAMTYVIYLSVLGALGVAGWLGSIWAARTGRRWARWAAAGMFALGTSVALFNLLVRDTSGDTGLPALLGWAGMLPCVAGLVAVVLLWRRPRQSGEA